MKTNFFFICFIVFLGTSCKVIKTQTAKSVDIYGAGVIHKPIIVDMDVNETKVTGTFAVSGSSNIEEAKGIAVAELVKKENADLLVEPIFEIETFQTGNGMNVKVTGFPAKYKNFRPIQSSDIELLKVGEIQKAKVYEANPSKGKKGVGSKIAGIFGGAIVSAIIAFILVYYS